MNNQPDWNAEIHAELRRIRKILKLGFISVCLSLLAVFSPIGPIIGFLALLLLGLFLLLILADFLGTGAARAVEKARRNPNHPRLS